LKRWLGGLQSRFERFREEKYFFPLPEFEIFPLNEDKKFEINKTVNCVNPPRAIYAHYSKNNN
jgi:hypothetical protein